MSAEPEQPVGGVEWGTLAFLCGAAVLCGLLELMFLIRFYAGTWPVPVTVLFALVSNVALPWWGSRVVRRVIGAVLPVVCWLIPVAALTFYNRPEGDLFLIDEYHETGAFYAFLLVGAGAGFLSIVLANPPRRSMPATSASPPRRPSPTTPSPTKTPGKAPTKRTPPPKKDPKNGPKKGPRVSR